MRVLVPLLTATMLGGSATAAVAVPGPPPLLQGWIVTERNPSRCLTGGPIGTVVHTSPCKAGNEAQQFYQTSEGHFTNNGNCMEPDGSKIRIAACTFRDEQSWWFTGTLRVGERGRCVTEVSIDRSGIGTVRLRACNDNPNRKWRNHTPW